MKIKFSNVSWILLFAEFLLHITIITTCSSAMALSQKKEDSVISSDGIILNILANEHHQKKIQARKVIKNDLINYYNTTAIPLGAGPSLNWSLEIESNDAVKVPLSLEINLPISFINSLSGKYHPEIFYYTVESGANSEEIEGVASLPSTFNPITKKISLLIEPSRAWEYFRKSEKKNNFLMMLIVGSSLSTEGVSR